MKIVIIEDEVLAADKIAGILKELDENITVSARLRSIESAVEWLAINPNPDLIISDIQLLDGLCFEIFRQVKVDCPVIFTTAYDQYAIRAFEVHSIDYLLKPVQKEKLKLSLDKFKAIKTKPEPLPIEQLLQYLKLGTTEYKSRFMVRFGQRIVAIPIEDVAFFYSESKLTFIVTDENKKYPIDQPLLEVEALLNPKHFFRINRQLIVRFDAIAEMHPYFKGRIKLKLNPEHSEEIVVSSERTPEFKNWLEQ